MLGIKWILLVCLLHRHRSLKLVPYCFLHETFQKFFWHLLGKNFKKKNASQTRGKEAAG
jgi:hypothetical protein